MHNTTKLLASAYRLERELGIRARTIKKMAAQGQITPIEIIGHKHPLYERKAVYAELGLKYE